MDESFLFKKDKKLCNEIVWAIEKSCTLEWIHWENNFWHLVMMETKDAKLVKYSCEFWHTISYSTPKPSNFHYRLCLCAFKWSYFSQFKNAFKFLVDSRASRRNYNLTLLFVNFFSEVVVFIFYVFTFASILLFDKVYLTKHFCHYLSTIAICFTLSVTKNLFNITSV